MASSVECEAMVLLHAFPLDAAMWHPQFAAAPPGWRILAPDVPGFGESDDREPPVSMDDFADSVLGLLDALGLHRVLLAGLSMGGYAALAILRRDPARVGALVLADTRAEADSEQARAGREALLARLEADGPAGIADEMAPRLLGPTARRERPELYALVREQISRNGREGIRNAIVRMRDRPDSTPILGTIRCPALVVVGEEDAVTTPVTARSLQAAIPGARLAVIPAAGHLSNLENPAAFNAALLSGVRS
jgi:pimeloyl-ACP methyl ester carboxylesterase